MNIFLRSIAIKLLSLGRLFPVFLTERKRVEALIKDLKPQCGNWEMIRLGPKGDGGYLVPNDLMGIKACFSPGVSSVSGFEKDCADLGMKVFMADRSVEHAAENHDLFHFTRKYVGVTTNEDFMTIDDWTTICIPNLEDELILQVDIEGYEYETFLNISDDLMKRCRIIVVEFHHLNQLWNEHFFRLASRAFEKILQTHLCVHIHPNNNRTLLNHRGLSIPALAEFTFLRKDRITKSSTAKKFPHPLDVDCSNNQHIALPSCWYDN